MSGEVRSRGPPFSPNFLRNRRQPPSLPNIHALGLVDQRGGHLGLAPTLAPSGPGGSQPSLSAFLDEVGQVPAEAVQAPDDQCVPRAQNGQGRLFMERATLYETWTRLPRFAEQLGAPVVQLQRLFADEWLPLIRVVSLPDRLRALDQRASAVQELDPDDYPAAALAALLSPCILLTHNTKDFAPLGVRAWTQGVDAVVAALDVRVGETRAQAVTMVPAAPVYAGGAGVKRAYEKIGPAALLVVVCVILGGIYVYRRQPEQRRQTIRTLAGGVGNFLMEEYTAASEAVQRRRTSSADASSRLPKSGAFPGRCSGFSPCRTTPCQPSRSTRPSTSRFALRSNPCDSGSTGTRRGSFGRCAEAASP